MDLSLCMIVKNEAAALPRCLESVRSVVDEMVVVDTGSTDETRAIAQSFGARVYHFPWKNDFAAARNESLKYAQGDWILVLDADEVLTAEVVPSLKQAIQHPDYVVINLLRYEVGAVQSPYSSVSRLFRNRPDIRFSRPYHALIDDQVIALLQAEPHWQIVDLAEVAIFHYGYEPEAIAHRNKYQKALDAMEGYLAEHPDDPYECNKLGALYVQLGEIEHGIELLKRGLQAQERATVFNAPLLYELHYHLGVAYARLHNTELAEAHYRAGLRQPIASRLKLGAYNNLGSLLKIMGDLDNARETYERCIEIDPTFAMGHYNLGTTLRALGQINEAIAQYEIAVQLNPNHAEAHQNLGVALIKLGKVEESLASFGRAIALHQQSNPQQAERLRQGLQEMGFQI